MSKIIVSLFIKRVHFYKYNAGSKLDDGAADLGKAVTTLDDKVDDAGRVIKTLDDKVDDAGRVVKTLDNKVDDAERVVTNLDDAVDDAERVVKTLDDKVDDMERAASHIDDNMDEAAERAARPEDVDGTKPKADEPDGTKPKADDPDAETRDYENHDNHSDNDGHENHEDTEEHRHHSEDEFDGDNTEDFHNENNDHDEDFYDDQHDGQNENDKNQEQVIGDEEEGFGGKNKKIKPSGNYDVDAKPTGKVTKIPPKADETTKRSLQRENEAAEVLARNGYNVEQNPKVPGTREPDYIIEGEIFDCYSPEKNTKVRGIWSNIYDKVVRKQQTERIVINLNDWIGNVDDIVKNLNDYPIDNLKEVIVVNGDSVISIYP